MRFLYMSCMWHKCLMQVQSYKRFFITQAKTKIFCVSSKSSLSLQRQKLNYETKQNSPIDL